MNLKLFEKEVSMQKWFEGKLAAGLSTLIDDIGEKQSRPATSAVERVEHTYKYCLQSLHELVVIAADEDIGLGPSQLRPDVLAYSPETESIVIVELKNSKNPTREAGTELSAYCAGINDYLPFISDADIVNVIVSNEWPTLLKKHVVQDLLWRRRKLLCLRPYKSANEIRLQIVTPEELGCSEMDLQLPVQNMGGYQLCLYSANRFGFDEFLPQMRSAMSAIAATGNLLGNHGFAFLWKDRWRKSQAPYSITILNVAAFKMLERDWHPEELTVIHERLWKLVDDFGPVGHGQSLTELTDEAKCFLRGFCSPKEEGFTTWPNLKTILDERAEYVSFTSWGLWGERHRDLLKEKYTSGETPIFDCPELGCELVSRVLGQY